MIQSLSIRNIALIENLCITFHTGLQVLTGETGAGKSIIMDAVNLILGGRADRTLIRTGSGKASVEAIFDIPDSSLVTELLQREGIEFDGSTVTVYREIMDGGKNICRVCGIITPISFLKEISPLLMNLHGQSEHQLLADPQTHLAYLDRLGDDHHQMLLERTGEACRIFLSNHKTYAQLVRRSADKEERIEQIQRDLEEISNASLKDGEEESLRQEMKRMDMAGRISETLKKAYHLLMTGHGEAGALQMIREASGHLKAASRQDQEADILYGRCDNLYYELEDISFQLSKLIGQTDFDPSRFEQMERRLELIIHLERKYGATIKDVLEKEESLKEEYRELIELDDRIKQTAADHKERLSSYRAAARELSESRRALAETFSKNMMRELKDLGMVHTVFEVHFAENTTGKPKMPTETGDDQAEFVISTNPGEPLLPLARIASGGELSRLMLAMKTLEAGHTGVDCMIFDEIDTGISGKAAQTVAEKLASISRYHQVICVSHLPQLASAGDYQYLVSKHVEGERTVTSVTELDTEGRIAEIARMVSGADGVSTDASHYAKQMLKAADRLKI